MEKTLFVRAFLLFGVSISLTLGAERTAAQGPAGAGASVAAQESSHSMNPIKWAKKDSKNSADTPGSRSDAEKNVSYRRLIKFHEQLVSCLQEFVNCTR